ncbi:hypothetical protein ABBQ38_010681 [Trebouxia sp. C0009 RCD-2024]
MAQIHLHASSQTFACESCGHLNVVPFSEPSLKVLSRSSSADAHKILEQVDLPPAGTSLNKTERTVSQAADNNDDLNALAAANAAKDGKLEQHLEELNIHQEQAHSPHHLVPRRASRLHPAGSIPRRSSILSRSSSEAQVLLEDQQLPQQSGAPQPHPPTSHLTNPVQGSGTLQHPALGSGRFRGLGTSLGGRSTSDAVGGNEVVLSHKGPTEVILEQIQRSTGSGHARTPSSSPMSKSTVPQMFNVSYPGAPPKLNRPSMLGAGEGSAAEGSSGSPKQNKESMFRCPICFEDLHRDDVFVASLCGHDMCRGCARQMVLTAISQLEFPLACPVCKAGPSPPCVHCEEVVRGHTNERYCSIDPDVQLLLSPEEYQDYMDKSMKFASNRDSELTSCPKPDCQGMAVVLSREPIFLCPLCNYAWCRRCKCDWHSFKTCDQHQREKLSSKHQYIQTSTALLAWK